MADILSMAGGNAQSWNNKCRSCVTGQKNWFRVRLSLSKKTGYADRGFGAVWASQIRDTDPQGALTIHHLVRTSVYNPNKPHIQELTDKNGEVLCLEFRRCEHCMTTPSVCGVVWVVITAWLLTWMVGIDGSALEAFSECPNCITVGATAHMWIEGGP